MGAALEKCKKTKKKKKKKKRERERMKEVWIKMAELEDPELIPKAQLQSSYLRERPEDLAEKISHI